MTISDASWVGGAFAQVAQRCIEAERASILAEPGIVSCGRVVAILETPLRRLDEITGLVDRFVATCVFGDLSRISHLTTELSSASYDCHPCDHFEGAQDVFDRSQHIASPCGDGSSDFTMTRLDENTDASLIEHVQSLYVASGLLAPPSYFLRGTDDPALAMVLVDDLGRVVGSAVAQDFSAAGRPYEGVLYLGPICLHPDVRGKRLSPWLCAMTILQGQARFASRRVWANVECGNSAASAVIMSAGLHASNQRGMAIVLKR